MREATARKLIEKKAIVYWQPIGHDRIGQYSPRIYGRIEDINFGIISVITPCGDRKTTAQLERVHECKNQDDIEWFKAQEIKMRYLKEVGR